MYLALFLVAILYFYITKGEKTKLYKYAMVSAVLILIPIARYGVDKYFQGFYEVQYLQWIIPVFAIVACAAVDIYADQTVKWKKCLIIPVICLVLLLSGFLSEDYRTDSKANSATDKKEQTDKNTEIENVFDIILQTADERQIIMVAPIELIEKARAYDGRLLTAYGRDIMETELDYAFYGNYEEWAYGLIEHMSEPLEDNEDAVFDELEQSGATYVVFDKEQLTFDEHMNYPDTMGDKGYSLKRIDETRHYVIYSR